jgi:hypothetical protein
MEKIQEILYEVFEELYQEHFRGMPPHDHFELEQVQYREQLKEKYEAIMSEFYTLVGRNIDLAEENCSLREILHNVSEAVNVTWS